MKNATEGGGLCMTICDTSIFKWWIEILKIGEQNEPNIIKAIE